MTDPQNSLDRLLELDRLFQNTGSHKSEELKYISLKKEIQGLIEKGESILNAHDDVFELGERKYWDIRKFGNAFKVETRMEYDKQHCEKIINLIIHAFQMNLDSELEQQNKALTEQVKEKLLRISILEKTCLIYVEKLTNLESERDQLKSKIEKIMDYIDIWNEYSPNSWTSKHIVDKLKEILGERNANL